MFSDTAEPIPEDSCSAYLDTPEEAAEAMVSFCLSSSSTAGRDISATALLSRLMPSDSVFAPEARLCAPLSALSAPCRYSEMPSEYVSIPSVNVSILSDSVLIPLLSSALPSDKSTRPS